jgi:hypothetical protein
MIRAIKLFHIVTAAIVLGADVTLLTLGIAALGPMSPPELYVAAHLIVHWLLGPMALAALVSGLLLARQLHYPLIRTKWVATKLAITAFLTTLVYVALEPGLAAVVAKATHDAGEALSEAIRWRYALVPAASSALLVLNVALAVLNARSTSGQQPRGGVS